MKKLKLNFLLIILTSLTALSIIGCSPGHGKTESALEKRLDTLMGKMSMQEKIEQLYYKTDGNKRLGIFRSSQEATDLMVLEIMQKDSHLSQLQLQWQPPGTRHL